MATKTFKIGEYARGGIITAEVTGKTVTIYGKEWDYSTGSRRSSDQSRAKTFVQYTVNSQSFGARNQLDTILNDLTSCYYAGKIIEWIETKVKLN